VNKESTHTLELDFGPDGEALIPVVTQDSRSREVLILAYANRRAFEETRASGQATYYSRSRQELWKKGLTSGDLLRVDEILINCEQNSLVYLVTPLGKGACHAKTKDGQPRRSCFYRRITPEGRLEFLEE
jgi:phosphoribosyl-AMP cyclohydrolase